MFAASPVKFPFTKGDQCNGLQIKRRKTPTWIYNTFSERIKLRCQKREMGTRLGTVCEQTTNSLIETDSAKWIQIYRILRLFPEHSEYDKCEDTRHGVLLGDGFLRKERMLLHRSVKEKKKMRKECRIFWQKVDKQKNALPCWKPWRYAVDEKWRYKCGWQKRIRSGTKILLRREVRK